VFIPLVRIGEGLIAFEASVFVSVRPLDPTCRHVDIVPSMLRRKAPATIFAFEGILLLLRMPLLFMLSVFCQSPKLLPASVTTDGVEESDCFRIETRTTVVDVQFLLLRLCKCSPTSWTIIPVSYVASAAPVDVLVCRAFLIHDPRFTLGALS
jgi:hypothetical protein